MARLRHLEPQCGVNTCARCMRKTLVRCSCPQWQHCMNYNTTSARLSELGATPAAQVSGGKLLPLQHKEKGHCQSLVTSAHHFLPPSSPQTVWHLTFPGTERSTERLQSSLTYPRNVCDAPQVIGQAQGLATWIFAMLVHQRITFPCTQAPLHPKHACPRKQN